MVTAQKGFRVGLSSRGPKKGKTGLISGITRLMTVKIPEAKKFKVKDESRRMPR